MIWLLLSKLLAQAIYPVGLTIITGVVALTLSAVGLARTSRSVLAVGIVILWIASTPIFANWIYARLEEEYPPLAVEMLPHADVAIVLGGALGPSLPPRLTFDASDAVDRVLHAARLFHAGRIEGVLVSAGNLPWQAVSPPEAELMAELLGELGVPRVAITLETQSRDTHENAVNGALVMTENGWKTALLVTSGAHMPRAVATFRKAGVDVVPAATDERVTNPLYASPLDVVPDADALARTTNALKEYLGLFIYRLRGWA